MKPPETHAEYLDRARQLELLEGRAAKLAVVASFTADFLRPYMIVESEKFGFLLKPWFAPFNQFEQMVMDSSSPLWQNSPDIIWFAMRPEDSDRYLPFEFASLNYSKVKDRLSVYRNRLVSLAKAARGSFNGPILVSNLTLVDNGFYDIFDTNNDMGITSIIAEENRLLAKEIGTIADTYVFDYSGSVALYGGKNWKDRRLWYMARTPMGQGAQKYLSAMLVRAASAVLRPPAKCLVLDLDNTLWGGVLGDDGPSGIILGDDYPGSAYKDFQAAILGYRNRGFLLAISSKSDDDLVRTTLNTHPEMILKTAHFADIQANWEPKAVSLRKIASNLNIGLDSLVFIDDNPLERVHVRSELPMVRVVEMPPDPLEYINVVANFGGLDRPRLLREDHARADMYLQESKRQEFGTAIADVGQFLSELQMEAQVGLFDSNTQERIHQLIHKTNQFNLTTRRHSMSVLERMANSENSRVAWLRLRDRFGELGLVCVGIIRQVEHRLWEIDTLLMSCRVMGRKVEDAFLAYLAELALSCGAERLRGTYVKSSKNNPVESFYNERGFVGIDRPNESTWVYERNISIGAFPWPEIIKRS